MAAPIKHTCPEIDRYIKSIKQTIIEERYLAKSCSVIATAYDGALPPQCS